MKEIDLKYDGPLTIAIGRSRKDIHWKNKEISWSKLVYKLSTALRTDETMDEYKAMSRAKRDEIKDVGGFVGGELRSGRRKANAILHRSILTLDLDFVPEGVDIWPTVSLTMKCAAVLYSTHSHTKKAQRLRFVIPLSRKVSPDEYVALARLVASDMGIDYCDDSTYEAHRLMYWPSVSKDAEYRYELSDAPWLDADKYLSRYKDWRDTSEWPVSNRKAQVIRRLAKKQGDPLEKPGVVGAFCRMYSIEEAIDEFL